MIEIEHSQSGNIITLRASGTLTNIAIVPCFTTVCIFQSMIKCKKK